MKFLFFSPKSSERHERMISGRVTFASGTTTSSGRAWAAADGGATGLFSIVFDTPIAELLAAHATVELTGTPKDIAVRIDSWTLSTRTLVVAVCKTSDGAHVDTDCVVNFTVHYKAVDVP